MAVLSGGAAGAAGGGAAAGAAHALRVVDAREPDAVLRALREAVGGGDAVNPRVDAAVPADLPATVDARVALVIETSGSTGVAKRVALSRDALLAGAAAADASLSGPGEWVLALPAHYVAGTNVLVRSIAAGTEPVILPSGHFAPAAFAAATDSLTAAVAYTSLVPAQLSTMLDSPHAAALRRFAAVLVGGQATPLALLARARDAGVTVVRTYGSSETSGGCVYDGVPVGATRAAIVDGQLELSGPTLADGYLGDPARTAATFVERDGVRWYRTGDAGTIDANGVVTVTGRLDDVIVSGGEKVSLGVVERAVRELPGLSGAVVVRAPHERWGEVPVVVRAAASAPAAAVPAAAAPAAAAPAAAAPAAAAPGEAAPAISLAELRAAVAAVAGRAAAPDRVVEVDAIPLLPSGKPDRVALTRAVAAI